jgi:hypothetical protein
VSDTIERARAWLEESADADNAGLAIIRDLVTEVERLREEYFDELAAIGTDHAADGLRWLEQTKAAEAERDALRKAVLDCDAWVEKQDEPFTDVLARAVALATGMP